MSNFIGLRLPCQVSQLAASVSFWPSRERDFLGPDGSEYGSIEAPVDGLYFSTGLGFFAQLTWYY